MNGETQKAGALRGEIDQINGRLLELLCERGERVLGLAALAREGQAPAGRDSEREEAMLTALKARNRGPFSDEEIEVIFRAIFEASLALKTRAR